MQIYWRKWTYTTYFGGEQEIFTPNETTEEQVRYGLNDKWGHDNWQHDSLKRGGLVKERKAFPRDLALAESGKS